MTPRSILILTGCVLAAAGAAPAAADPALPTLNHFDADVLRAVERAALDDRESPALGENHEAMAEELPFEERHGGRQRSAFNTDDDSCHYARGHTLVCHVFIDHSGGTWQQAERDSAGAKAQMAKNYFTMNAPAESNLMFDNGWSNVYYSYDVTFPGNIPTDSMSTFISELVLGMLGFSDSDTDGVFIDDASQFLQTVNGGFDNAIVVFQPADITGRAFASYSYGRAFQYTDDSGAVWTHEWGHLFGSCDEYVEDGECGGGMNCGPCQSEYVTGTYNNSNCELMSCGTSVDCLMIDNTFNGICASTLGHWAWVDSDSDGQLDNARRRVFLGAFSDIWELWDGGSFQWTETSDGMVYHQSDASWSVVGLRSPLGGDFDLHLYGDNNYDQSYATSTFVGGSVDFVVGDYNHNNLGNEHVFVSENYNFGNLDYHLGWESGTQLLYPDGLVRAGSWNAEYVVRVWDVPLYGGEDLVFTLNASAGLDLGMALFDSNGGSYWAGRASAAWEQDGAGAGGTETYSYPVPSDDVYGLVVWSNTASAGTFDLQIGPSPIVMVEQAPYVASQGLALHQYEPNAAAFSVVGTRPSPGADNQIAVFSDESFQNELAISRDYAGGAEFVVADHNNIPLNKTWVRVVRNSGAGASITQWEHDADDLRGIAGGTWNGSDVVRIWDANVEAGQEYFLRGYHNSLDCGLSVFEAASYHQSRKMFAVEGNVNPPSVGGEWFPYTSPVSKDVAVVQFANGGSSDVFQNWWGPRFVMANDVAIPRLDQVVWGIHGVTAGYWNVFAQQDSTTSGNISLYGDEACTLSQLLATDQSSASTVAYVVGDFNHSPAGTYWTRAWHDGETDMTVEWEGGTETLAEIHGQVVESYQAWPNGDVAEVWDLWLYNGDTGPHSVVVQVEPLNPDMDLDVALFSSDHTTFYGSPANAVAQSANPGPGTVESMTYNVREDDWYGLVVTNRGERGGEYVIRIGPAEAVAVGDPEFTPEFAFAASPNPFRGRSQLSFSITRDEAVDLAVYDVTGRRVRQLQSGVLPAGAHVRHWDGRDDTGRPVAAGVYLARLDTSRESRTRKIVRVP